MQSISRLHKIKKCIFWWGIWVALFVSKVWCMSQDKVLSVFVIRDISSLRQIHITYSFMLWKSRKCIFLISLFCKLTVRLWLYYTNDTKKLWGKRVNSYEKNQKMVCFLVCTLAPQYAKMCMKSVKTHRTPRKASKYAASSDLTFIFIKK